MIYFFIQARTGSSRLPNKVLLPFYCNKNILEIIIETLKNNFTSIPIVVCTSLSIEDDRIEETCKEENVACFRGHEENVLKRFIDAAEAYEAKYIIRVCADNPFLNVNFLKQLIQFYRDNPEADYWSFKNSIGIPVIKTHFGFFAEIVSVQALKKVHSLTHNPLYLEHVTNYIYEHEMFKCNLKFVTSFLENREDLRFTIDDGDDLILMQQLFAYYIQANHNLEQTISFLDQNSALLTQMKININKYSK